MHSIKIEAGNEILHKIVNARMIELYTNAFTLTEETDANTGIIKSITIGNYKIQVGDKFSHKEENIPSTYDVFKIEKGADPKYNFRHKYTIVSHLRNKTTDYILPCLGKNKEYFDVDGYLVNAYLGKDDSLCLLYRFATTEYYGKLETNLTTHPRFIKIDSSIPGFDLFMYSIPKPNWDDVKLFKKGKYSKFSQGLKLNIKCFYGLSVKSNLWKILTKDESLVKQKEDEFKTPKGFFWNIDLDEKPKMQLELWE
jgi:hypothetical protein